MIHHFYLSITLRIIACTNIQTSSHQLEQFLPKDACQFAISITHNGIGKPMQLKNFMKEQGSHLAFCKCGLQQINVHTYSIYQPQQICNPYLELLAN